MEESDFGHPKLKPIWSHCTMSSPKGIYLGKGERQSFTATRLQPPVALIQSADELWREWDRHKHWFHLVTLYLVLTYFYLSYTALQRLLFYGGRSLVYLWINTKLFCFRKTLLFSLRKQAILPFFPQSISWQWHNCHTFHSFPKYIQKSNFTYCFFYWWK